MSVFKTEDFLTPTWRRLTQHLEARLQALRELNDTLSNTPDKTASIRGQIVAVKEILALSRSASHVDGQGNFPIVKPSDWQP